MGRIHVFGVLYVVYQRLIMSLYACLPHACPGSWHNHGAHRSTACPSGWTTCSCPHVTATPSTSGSPAVLAGWWTEPQNGQSVVGRSLTARQDGPSRQFLSHYSGVVTYYQAHKRPETRSFSWLSWKISYKLLLFHGKCIANVKRSKILYLGVCHLQSHF